jgi:Protein of unknown function (DUF3531)
MQVSFREFDPFDVWFWIEFPLNPSEQEKQYVEEIFDSWFFLGKLGGFNAENLQIQDTGNEISYMQYDNDKPDDTYVSLMHNMGEFEYEGNWGRVWMDLGTSDAIAIDILVNALLRLSQEFVPLEQVILGGENEDWRTPERENPDFVNDGWN